MLWAFSAPFSCLFHKGLSSPWQPVIGHHKGFYLAIRWLMSLEPSQSIKCYNLIGVFFSARPHPLYTLRTHSAKKRIGDGQRENKAGVKKIRL